MTIIFKRYYIEYRDLVIIICTKILAIANKYWKRNNILQFIENQMILWI